MRSQVVGHADSEGELFELIVGGKLCGIDNSVTHNIGADTDPETRDAILGNRLFVAVNGILVRALFRWKCALTLHSNLNQVSWVSYGDTNGTCCETSQNFLEQSRILTGFHWATNDVTDRYVEANTETRVNELTLQAWCKAVPESCDALLRSDDFDSS